jgi:molybdate transport system substrate-binding protein
MRHGDAGRPASVEGFFMITRWLVSLLVLLLHATVQAGEITVSAASSLTEAFSEAGKRFESLHPGGKVRFNFGASGALLQQIAAGAPVDVFASADQETMDLAQTRRLIVAEARRDFARNALVVAVPIDARVQIDSLRALTDPRVERIAIGNPASVPVGRYAKQALHDAALWDSVSAKAVNTLNVRQSLDYVARGEVDAAFVYATDLRVMPDRVKLAYSVALERAIRYPIAPVVDSAQADAADRFIAFVLSDEGQNILRKFGFQAP